MTGHQLARELLKKHRVDRYPSVESTMLKLMTEVGELVDAWQKPGKDMNDVAKEYADVGLSLYVLGNKLFLDLDQEMSRVVEKETRIFT